MDISNHSNDVPSFSLITGNDDDSCGNYDSSSREMEVEDCKDDSMLDETIASFLENVKGTMEVGESASCGNKQMDRAKNYTRLIRKLKNRIDKFAQQTGQQVALLWMSPEKKRNFHIHGTSPLIEMLQQCKPQIKQLGEFAKGVKDETKFALPTLHVNGIPSCLKHMHQADLRQLIPTMLKYSTGRGRPGWGIEDKKPVWWPQHIPWKNVRIDYRTDEQKQEVSWTDALREIVECCYAYHGRQDLLTAAVDDPVAQNTHSRVIKFGSSSRNFYTIMDPNQDSNIALSMTSYDEKEVGLEASTTKAGIPMPLENECGLETIDCQENYSVIPNNNQNSTYQDLQNSNIYQLQLQEDKPSILLLSNEIKQEAANEGNLGTVPVTNEKGEIQLLPIVNVVGCVSFNYSTSNSNIGHCSTNVEEKEN